MEKLAQFLNDNTPLRILDIGTGNGNFIDIINRLYQGYDELYGIDTESKAIASARKNYSSDSIKFQKMDANHMSFSANRFDLICLSNTLHHLADVKKTFDEVTRVLDQDGYFVVAEMISNDLTSKQKSHLLLHHFAAKLDRLKGHTHDNTMTQADILTLCKKDTNLRVVDHWILQYHGAKENSDQEMTWLLETIDKLISQWHEKEIIEEANDIKEYIIKHGFDSCPTMIVVMKK